MAQQRKYHDDKASTAVERMRAYRLRKKAAKKAGKAPANEVVHQIDMTSEFGLTFCGKDGDNVCISDGYWLEGVTCPECIALLFFRDSN